MPSSCQFDTCAVNIDYHVYSEYNWYWLSAHVHCQWQTKVYLLMYMKFSRYLIRQASYVWLVMAPDVHSLLVIHRHVCTGTPAMFTGFGEKHESSHDAPHFMFLNVPVRAHLADVRAP